MKFSPRIISGLAGLVALATVSFTKPAEARPMEKGTFLLSAERLTGLTVAIPSGGSAAFGANLLFAAASNPNQFPRAAADYFVIDGLSIGGSVGLSYLGNCVANPQGGDTGCGAWGILPRIGYAFGITSALDVWPRLTLGVGGGLGANSQVQGTMGLEGAFIWKATPNFGLEFGPNFDVLFGSGSTVIIGVNAGLAYRF
jgi:hypothetical protein